MSSYMQQLQVLDRICRCGRSPREARPDMRWKIIFWIMFLIWSNVPEPGVCLSAAIFSASFSSAAVCFELPALRNKLTIAAFGSEIFLEIWIKLIPLLSGVRTPVTFERISMALPIASISSARVFMRFSYSSLRSPHNCFVSSSTVVSASRELVASESVDSAVDKS